MRFLSLVALGLITLQGCAPTVRLEAAPEANAVECANMMVRLPDDLAGLERRSVNAQSTAAWGDPTAVIVRCGLPKPPPSTLPCASVDGVDWLIDDSDRPRYVFRTYGLDPSTEVIVDSEVVSGTEVLDELPGAVGSQSAPVAKCIDVTDVYE
jgi:hypothetical protein